jgi:hypothetical protein
LNTESVEQTELSKEYDKGFTKGYAEGKKDGITERPRTSFVDWLNSKKR